MKWIGMVLIMLMVINTGCKKEDVDTRDATALVIDTLAHDNRVTSLMKEAADIIEKVYQINRAYNEANAAIHSGYYHDQRILLRDLLFPASSELYKYPAFRALKADTGYFRRAFCEIILRGHYPLLMRELKAVLFGSSGNRGAAFSESRIPGVIGVLSPTDPLAIYFPYAENFPFFNIGEGVPNNNKIVIMKKPTLVYCDREADNGVGRDVYYCISSPDRMCYRNVFVDDNYASANPTHIITVGATRNNSSVNNVPKTELVHRVYHGSSRLVSQLDKLLSFTGNGGGSEIKVCRINGYLRRSDEHIDDFAGDVVTLHYTRGEIRKKQWKRVFSVWDPNWNYQDVEQIYAVYEEDTRGVKTIDGTLKTTLSLPGRSNKVEGDIGFKIQTNTQDEIITQRKIDRKSYLRDGLNNQGWAFFNDPSDFLPGLKDWPIYDGGSIWHYTLPFRIY